MVELTDDEPGSPFHRGEISIQTTVGVRSQMRVRESFLRDHLTAEQRDFFNHIPFLGLATEDLQGWPAATIVAGTSGFAMSPDKHTLTIRTERQARDPVLSMLNRGRNVGILGIEFTTQRRNRAFGTISRISDDTIDISIVQAFGNCPQYIQRRELAPPPAPSSKTSRAVREAGVSDGARSLIERADCFFVASLIEAASDDPRAGVDISHRGGRPGFVKVNGNALTVPDFAGNFFFNTLGNFLLNPKAGLVFWDFANGDLLHVRGTVEIIWSNGEVDAFRGAERLWRVHVDDCLWQHGAAPQQKGTVTYSTLLNGTGTWEETTQRLNEEAGTSSLIPLTVTAISKETPDVKSFYLTPAPGAAIPIYRAGQFTRVQLSETQTDTGPRRNYTLSSAPEDAFLRISVKRQGALSNVLHDKIVVGDKLYATYPSGAFTISTKDERSAVLIAGGIGITPMVSFLRHIIGDTVRPRFKKPLILIHATQTSADQVFRDEVDRIQTTSEGYLSTCRFVECPSSSDRPGVTYDAARRLNADDLNAIATRHEDADYYLCGPPGFMQSVYDDLVVCGVDDTRIFAEAFGPASLRRSRTITERTTELRGDAQARVRFEVSGIDAGWHPRDGSLLDLAEALGLTPAHSCRAGWCGTCLASLRGGTVEYPVNPVTEIAEDTVLLCSARPRVESDGEPRLVVIDL